MEVLMRFVGGSLPHLFISLVLLACSAFFVIRLRAGMPILRYKRPIKKIPGSFFGKRVKVELKQWEKSIANAIPAAFLCLAAIVVISLRLEEFNSSFDGIVLSKEKVEYRKSKGGRGFNYYVTLEKDGKKERISVNSSRYNLMTKGKYVRKLPQRFERNYDVQLNPSDINITGGLLQTEESDTER